MTDREPLDREYVTVEKEIEFLDALIEAQEMMLEAYETRQQVLKDQLSAIDNEIRQLPEEPS